MYSVIIVDKIEVLELIFVLYGLTTRNSFYAISEFDN